MPLLCIYFDVKITTPRLQQRNSCWACCVPTPSTSVGTHLLLPQDWYVLLHGTSTSHRCVSETFNGCDLKLAVQFSFADAYMAWRYDFSDYIRRVPITIVAVSGRRTSSSLQLSYLEGSSLSAIMRLRLRLAASGNICCTTSPQFQRSPYWESPQSFLSFLPFYFLPVSSFSCFV